MEKDYKAYVNHILDAISSIERYTEGMSFAAFERDNKTIDAIIRNFEIIGEASSKLPKEFREISGSSLEKRNRIAKCFNP